MICGLPALDLTRDESVFLVLTKRKTDSGDEIGQISVNSFNLLLLGLPVNIAALTAKRINGLQVRL